MRSNRSRRATSWSCSTARQAFSLVGVNALVAASGIVIPIPPQPLALEGLGHLLGSIETVRRRVGADARILGMLITMAGPDTNHGAALRERLRAEYRERVFHTEIATSRALQEAPGAGRTIFSTRLVHRRQIRSAAWRAKCSSAFAPRGPDGSRGPTRLVLLQVIRDGIQPRSCIERLSLE
jgi:cellulose biosynthesis protein BcsQ